jgi:hypothetical protein
MESLHWCRRVLLRGVGGLCGGALALIGGVFLIGFELIGLVIVGCIFGSQLILSQKELSE